VLKAGAADILQPDVSACGGLSEGRRVVDLATAFHTPVYLHVWGSGVAVAASLQLTAMIPPCPRTLFPVAGENDILFEYDRNPNPLRDELLAVPFELEGERLHIPQGPGLGVDIDQKALARFTVSCRTSR
jgi:D-galactarolactone cycloisomerase